VTSESCPSAPPSGRDHLSRLPSLLLSGAASAPSTYSPSVATAQAAGGAAPWWGVPLLAALFTVLGVLIAQLMTRTAERRKICREDELRWLADRRQAYASYIAQATQLRLRFVDARQYGLDTDTDTGKQYIEQLNDHREHLKLIAPTAVVKDADATFMSALTLWHAVRKSAGDFDRVDKCASELWESIEQLRRAARIDLGVEPGAEGADFGLKGSGGG
jgi:hypothetical protein